MAGNTANPRVWLLGDVYVAPVGTTGPTNTTSSLNAAFDALGLLHEDGLTQSREEDSTDLYAWGGILVRTVRSKHKRSFVVTVLEDNPTVFALVNPGSTATDDGTTTTRTIKRPTTDPRTFVFETQDGDVTRRIHVPRAEVTAVGDATSSEADMETRELTSTGYPDATTGVLFYEITDYDKARSA